MSQYLGIDVGSKRIGLALGSSETGLARPWRTVSPDELPGAIAAEPPFAEVIVGLPRNLASQDTAQTLAVRRFVEDVLVRKLHLDPIFQDEAATSAVAEERLIEAGKPYTKGDIDAEAASIILQDYMDAR